MSDGRYVTAEEFAEYQRALVVYRQGVQAEGQRLHLEAEVGRVLNRYSRRTWVVMAASIVWVVLALNDLARAYADSTVWDLLFWTTHHGPGQFHWFQVLGFAWQVAVLAWLWKRSQVPDWLVDRVRAPRAMAMSKDDMERLRALHLERDAE